MYSVKLYYNTGFNSINIPDTDGLLNNSNTFTSLSFPPLDILQNTNIESVKIKATFDQVKDADFCCIFTPGSTENTGAFYYFIDGVTMRSVDVAELSLVPDYITSAGGPASLKYTDGIARRCHVTDDTYGKWNLEDDYLTPSEPLQLETEVIRFNTGTYDVVESSIDVAAMAGLTEAWSYEDGEDDSVVVPRSVANFKTTKYQLDGNQGGDTRTTLFIIGDSVKSGIEQCRALGIEDVILNTAYIPKALVNMTVETETIEEQQTIPIPSVVVLRGDTPITNFIGGHLKGGTITAEAVLTASGNFKENITGFKYEYDENVKNKRVLYGGLNRVGILTTSGDKLESRPEEVKESGQYIIIKSIGDPHTNGCAYHRFKTMNSDATNLGFWKNAVKGLPWKQIPLLYMQKSGSALDRVNFENSREITDFEYYSSNSGILTGGKGIQDVDVTTGQATPHRGALFGGPQDIGLLGRLGAATSNLFLGSVLNPAQKYHIQRRQELQNFAIGQASASPDLQFAYDGEAFRDFYGECIIVYRYRPTATDLARLDKILTMYGYRVNMPINTDIFSGRDYFNYVEASVTVSGNINGNLPRWWCEGISQQMAAGVRVWHVKPDPSYYNDNPITVTQ